MNDSSHIFGAARGHFRVPFDQINEDPARTELDRRIIDVLLLQPWLADAGGPLDLLRQKLAAEPQIHANKQSRVVFTPNGEKNVRR